MSNIRTTLQIAAEPQRVWQALTDFAAWPQWNPIIRRIQGDLRVGATVRFRIRLAGAPELPIAAKFVRCVATRELAWRGGAPVFPSLAWGEHYFRVEPSGDGTLFTHGEDFGGLLAMVMVGSTHARVTRSYETMNRALRDLVERG